MSVSGPAALTRVELMIEKKKTLQNIIVSQILRHQITAQRIVVVFVDINKLFSVFFLLLTKINNNVAKMNTLLLGGGNLYIPMSSMWG